MNKKRILPSWLILIDSNERSPPSKQRTCRLTYEEKRDFLMSNKCVKSVFVRQRASPDQEEQRLVCLSHFKILGNIYLFCVLF